MDWITDTICIGNYLDAQDVIRHRAEGIRSMVSLDGKLVDVAPAKLGLEALEAFNLVDGHGNDRGIFQRVVEAIGLLARRHPKLLVQCHAGKSRSVVAVAAHLMKSQGLDWRAAIQAHVNQALKGWYGYFKRSLFSARQSMDGWVRARLRNILYKRRGRIQYLHPNTYFPALGWFSLAQAQPSELQSLRTRSTPTGEPEAGDPPVRFGGRGRE